MDRNAGNIEGVKRWILEELKLTGIKELGVVRSTVLQDINGSLDIIETATMLEDIVPKDHKAEHNEFMDMDL